MFMEVTLLIFAKSNTVVNKRADFIIRHHLLCFSLIVLLKALGAFKPK